jgi:hypothetical protein
MNVRVLIEFVVEVPNMDVAGDVGMRLTKEHRERLREVFRSVTGFDPFFSPDQPGFGVGLETVTWNDKEKDWVGEGDDDDDDDDDE